MEFSYNNFVRSLRVVEVVKVVKAFDINVNLIPLEISKNVKKNGWGNILKNNWF